MTEPNPPSLLFVSRLAHGELEPSGVSVHVVLTADKLFSGRAAMQKATELRRLCSALEERGVSEQRVELQGVALDVSTGLFTRASSVTYRVRVHLRELASLPAVLDAIAASKNATLTGLAWDYDDSASTELELLRQCATQTQEHARTLAAALGARIEGIHSIREDRIEDAPTIGPASMADMPSFKRRATTIESELAGLELAPKKTITVRLSVEYRVASTAL